MEPMTAAGFAAWRKRLGKTQAKVAEALGMSRRQVQHYESGSQAVPTVVFLATYTLEHLWKKFQDLDRERDGPGSTSP